MLNQVNLIGNLTANPEVKTTQNGTKVATFTLVTNRYWKDTNGEKKEEATFHNIVVWAHIADIAERYLLKGNKVCITGRISNRSWETDSGEKRYKTEIIGENMILLTPKQQQQEFSEDTQKEKTETSPSQKKAHQVSQSSDRNKSQQDEIRIEDIPF